MGYAGSVEQRGSRCASPSPKHSFSQISAPLRPRLAPRQRPQPGAVPGQEEGGCRALGCAAGAGGRGLPLRAHSPFPKIRLSSGCAAFFFFFFFPIFSDELSPSSPSRTHTHTERDGEDAILSQIFNLPSGEDAASKKKFSSAGSQGCSNDLQPSPRPRGCGLRQGTGAAGGGPQAGSPAP